ncbi:MAG: outer membrane protein assembly factor BamD [Xanthomonadaceae bacterium]|nr:outer membrane protein assembly factor BamD [Xanthomonadaceae bacterium]
MKRITLFILLTIIGIGCSGKPVDESNPQSVYEDALEDINNERYQLAQEKLRTVRNKFPYSAAATEAHLKIADIYFLQEAYVEAAAAYEAFRDLHPKHEKSGYASFRIGESYYKDIPDTISRDLTSAYKAQDSIQAFIEQSNDQAQTTLAKKYLLETRTALASKEFYIAKFYSKQEDHPAVIVRCKKILELYPETDIANQAKELLEKSEKK